MKVVRLLSKLFLAALLGLVVFLVAGEFITSRTKEGNAVDFVRDDDLVLVRRPNATGWSWMTGTNRWVPVSINEHHMRDAEIPVERDEDEVRILCVGDSFTYGGGLAQEETFPHFMQQRYGPPAESGVRVMNGGANGWTTRYQRVFIEKKMDALDPDVVVLAFNWNDLWSTGDFTDEEASVRILGDGCWLCRIGAAYDRVRATHFYRYLHQRKHGARKVPTPAAREKSLRNYRELTHRHSVEPEEKLRQSRQTRFGDRAPPHHWWVMTDRKWFQNTRRELEALDRFLDGREVPLVVAIMPEPSWWGPGPLPAKERLVEILDHAGVPWFDVQERFVHPQHDGTRQARRVELWQEFDPVHPNVDGQKVIANAICSFLAKQEIARPR